MIQIKIPKEMSDIETRLIGSFSLRQTLALIVGGGIIYVLHTFLHSSISEDMFIGLCVITAAPVLACGFIPASMLQGMHFETYIKMMAKYNLLVPTKRKYKTENTMDGLAQQLQDEERLLQKKKIEKRTKQEKKQAKEFAKTVKGIK